jgi:hypothetical protein
MAVGFGHGEAPGFGYGTQSPEAAGYSPGGHSVPAFAGDAIPMVAAAMAAAGMSAVRKNMARPPPLDDAERLRGRVSACGVTHIGN